MLDYEYAEQRVLAFGCEVIWFPDVLRNVCLPRATRRVAQFYSGLKENLYLDNWRLDRMLARSALGIGDSTYLVVARPPAETAHYASGLSRRLWVRAVQALAVGQSVKILVTARTAAQRTNLVWMLGDLAAVRFLDEVVDGPELIVAADLVLGGGGTMNREAAVLGVPVWSVFNGPPPAIDIQLASEGRLRWIRSEQQLEVALGESRPARLPRRGPFPEGLECIIHDLRARLES
jgi:hypothetical protein